MSFYYILDNLSDEMVTHLTNLAPTLYTYQVDQNHKSQHIIFNEMLVGTWNGEFVNDVTIINVRTLDAALQFLRNAKPPVAAIPLISCPQVPFLNVTRDYRNVFCGGIYIGMLTNPILFTYNAFDYDSGTVDRRQISLQNCTIEQVLYPWLIPFCQKISLDDSPPAHNIAITANRLSTRKGL